MTADPPFTITTAERVATIVNGFLAGGGYEGRLGRLEIVERSAGRIFIVSPKGGPKCAVFATPAGWSVAPYTASDNPMPPSRHHDLETAARMALGQENRA